MMVVRLTPKIKHHINCVLCAAAHSELHSTISAKLKAKFRVEL